MADMTGRNWESGHELIDVAVMLKKLRYLQQDADFEDNAEDYAYYKGMADYYQKLSDKGQEFNVNF